MKPNSRVLVGAIAFFAACSGGASTPAGNPGTGGYSPGMSGAGGATGSGGITGTGGGTGSGGATGSGGTTSLDAQPEAAPTDVAAEAGGGGFSKQFTCPAGPFPDDNIGPRTPVCAGFKFRYGYNEGPTWIASQNAFFFSNFVQGNGHFGDIIKVDFATKQCEIFIMDAGCNGLAVNANGKLIGACHLTHSITEFDLVTKQKRVIADTYNGRNFASPNDLVVHSSGTIYFSNPTFESISQNPYPSAAFWIDPLGKVTLLANGGCNGVALSPDEKTLYISGMGHWAVDANGVPGTHAGGDPGGDGISINCANKAFTPATNSAFGGPDGKTLIIVQGNGASFAQMMVPGLP